MQILKISKKIEREKYQAIDHASEKFAKDLLTPLIHLNGFLLLMLI